MYTVTASHRWLQLPVPGDILKTHWRLFNTSDFFLWLCGVRAEGGLLVRITAQRFLSAPAVCPLTHCGTISWNLHRDPAGTLSGDIRPNRAPRAVQSFSVIYVLGSSTQLRCDGAKNIYTQCRLSSKKSDPSLKAEGSRIEFPSQREWSKLQ